MPMFGIDNIHDKEGKLLSTILEELKGGSNGKPADLKDYAKAEDVKALKDTVEQLIKDLKDGKYVASSVSPIDVKEDKATKETVKEK